ncbi:MAG: hypothetical protein II141_01185, partial [Clostridia bacterium]|nr:hypothetical protein [Clostridia bacterium]
TSRGIESKYANFIEGAKYAKALGSTVFGSDDLHGYILFFRHQKVHKGENEALEPGFQERETFRIEKKDADFSRFGTISPSGA